MTIEELQQEVARMEHDLKVRSKATRNILHYPGKVHVFFFQNVCAGYEVMIVRTTYEINKFLTHIASTKQHKHKTFFLLTMTFTFCNLTLLDQTFV